MEAPEAPVTEGLLLDDDLLLDGLPDVGLLDDFQLDCGLDVGELDGLGLDFGACTGSGAGAPASSDLLESLQLNISAFGNPASSSGARHSPSHSDSDSPVVLPLVSGVPASGPRTVQHPQQQVPSRAGSAGSGASPATSESENNGHGRSNTPTATTSGRRAADGQQGQRPLTDEEKRLARMQRNRENAQLSRMRKKQQMTDLETRCTALLRQNATLAGAVQRLTAENAALRQQLVLVCQQAGRANNPPAAGTGAAPAKPAQPQAAGAKLTRSAAAGPAKPAQPAAMAPIAAAKGLLPQWPVLPFGLLPKVTLPTQQPAGQAAAKPAAAPPQAAAQATARVQRPAPAAAAPASRPAKRAKTAAGASTAFLALFTLFMFAGPFTPAPLRNSANTAPLDAPATLAGMAGSQRTLQALPDPAIIAAATATAGASNALESSALHHTGRGLQALPAAATEGDVLPPPHHPPHALPPPRGALQQLLNSTLQALLLDPGNAALEAAALQRLQELGPVALLLDADGPGHSANPLAASVAFPRLAGQLFGASGLEVPRMCQKVLEFDAASVPHAVRSRRSLERYILGATGFRGRSLAAAGSGAAKRGAATEPEPLRIEQPRQIVIGEEHLDEEELAATAAEALGDLDERDGASTALLPVGGGEERAPVLVSVLLPANASEDGELASADKVFVVLLHPRERYTTYSCALPRPVAL